VSTPEVKRLFWLAVLALIFTAAIAALAIWCASRPVVSFPLAPRKAAAAERSKFNVQRSTFNGSIISAPFLRQEPTPHHHNSAATCILGAALSAGFTPAFVTNPSGGAMAPAAFPVRTPLVVPAVYSRRKVVSGDLPPEGVISSESERESERGGVAA
jgi:hypothetical protein